MGKTGKWIIGTLAALVALLMALALCLPLLIDPNTYKEIIVNELQKQTGRQISIPGDIEMKVSPIGLKTSFRLGTVRLSSPPGFPDTELLTSRLAEIQLALWPLISNKELRVNAVRLEGVSLNLVREQDGRSNWGTPPAQGEKPGSGQSPPPGPKTGSQLAAIDIGGVLIKDLSVSFVDRQSGEQMKLADLNLTVGRIRPDSPIPVQGDFAFTLSRADRLPLTARVKAQSTFLFLPDGQLLSIRDFAGNIQLAGGSPPIPEIGMAVAADLDVDLRQEKVDIKKLTLQKDDLRVEAVLSITNSAALQAAGTLRIPNFSPRAQAAAWGITLPLADPQALTRMAADLEFRYDPAALAVNKLDLSLDDASVTGTVAARNLQEQPTYDLTLHVNQLDLNRYGTGRPAAPAASSPGGPAPPATRSNEEPLLPVALLRGLNFNADLTFDSLKTAKLSLNSVRLRATGRQGLLTLSPLAAGLYDGTATVNGEIDARPDIPKFHVTPNAKGIQLGPLFRDLTGKEEVTGRADVSAELTSSGLTRSELTRGSNGTMKLAVADGRIDKLQIIDTIRTAKTLLGTVSGKSAGAGGSSGQIAPGQSGTGGPTTFATLTATGILQNGVFKNDDLQAESDLMRVTGQGTVDLNSERIDYLLTIYLAKSIDRSGQTDLADLADTPIPYRVRGTFERIEQSAALEEIAKSQAKKVLFKELEKRLGGEKKATDTQQQGTNSTEELINKGLKSLFGQ